MKYILTHPHNGGYRQVLVELINILPANITAMLIGERVGFDEKSNPIFEPCTKRKYFVSTYEYTLEEYIEKSEKS